MSRSNFLFGSTAVAACALALGARAEVRAVTPTVWEGGNTNSWQRAYEGQAPLID